MLQDKQGAKAFILKYLTGCGPQDDAHPTIHWHRQTTDGGSISNALQIPVDIYGAHMPPKCQWSKPKPEKAFRHIIVEQGG